MSLRRHEYLYLENEASDMVYILEHGMIMLTKLMPNGREVGIALLTGENFFGHCEILACTQREHQAMSLSPCIVWGISSKIFNEETSGSSEFNLALARLQNERLRHVEHHIHSITQDTVSKRLATTLLKITPDKKCEPEGCYCISPCPTHQDLAVMISSTRETVSMTMNKFRSENIIDFDRKTVKILNKALLESIE